MTEATDQRKPRLYLAGKMRGEPFYAFDHFDAHRDSLSKTGWDVVSPADIDRACGFEALDLPADTDWGVVPEAAGTLDEIMLRDIEALETCDAIYMMRGWEDSSGANRELAEARKLGLREFYEDVCASPSPKVMSMMDEANVEYNKAFQRECDALILKELASPSPSVVAPFTTEYLQTPKSEIVDMQTGETRTVDASGERVFDISAKAVADHRKRVDDAIMAEFTKAAAEGWNRKRHEAVIRKPEQTETRITDPVTGGQKGSKPAMFALIPSESLWELAELYGYGAAKYDADNWRRGYSWRLSFSALMRHLWAFWRGEDRDPESGFKHLTHAAWHCMTLAWFMDNRRSHDDRPKSEVAT